jgi:mannose-6-phosphate isomerase-like protein (cupin superfamily)
MADYTIKNLRELEDMAPRFGLSPDVEARFTGRELGLTRSGLSLQRLAPNATQPFGHRHKQQEELFVVLAGSGRAKLDDEIVKVRAWDAIRVAPQVTRAFAAGPDGLEFLAFGAPAVASPAEDVESEPGWRP